MRSNRPPVRRFALNSRQAATSGIMMILTHVSTPDMFYVPGKADPNTSVAGGDAVDAAPAPGKAFRMRSPTTEMSVVAVERSMVALLHKRSQLVSVRNSVAAGSGPVLLPVAAAFVVALLDVDLGESS